MVPEPPDADEIDPLERLTDEYLHRRRSGEFVDLESFAAEHPAHAQEILTLFPTLLRLEGARTPEPARARDRLGRWSIVRELGRGGMAVVYLAEDESTGRRAAVKVVSGELPGAIARFRREAQAVSRVVHPGICRVLEIGPEGESQPWIALEYVEGETLAQRLKRERREVEEGKPRTHDPDRWLAVAEQVALALHAAHEAGLVHRDVKPGNVMLTPDGGAVVLDFGLVHGDATSEETRITRTGVPVGTPAYMSPEQIRAGPTPVDRRTDVYSLGATLYEALTLEPPFSGPTIASLFSQVLSTEPTPLRRKDPRLARDLEVVVATALEKEPARRYATAGDLAEDLRRVRRGERVHARAAGPVRRLALWAGRNPGVAAVVGSVALALVTGLVVALVLLARVGEARDREAAAARHARSRALASAAAEVARNDAMLALLLAREAVRTERTAETVSQLHAAVHGSLERARLEGHGNATQVTSLSWDAAGKTVATGAEDGRARIFSADGTLRATIPASGSGKGVEVALSPSGERLLTRDVDGTVRLWRADGAGVARLTSAAEPAMAALFLADGTAVVAGAGGSIALYDADGAPRAAWDVPARGSRRLALIGIETSDDPTRIHVLTSDLRALTYDAEGNEVMLREQAVGAARARLLPRGRLAHMRRGPETAASVTLGPGDDVLDVVAADGTSLGTVRAEFGEDAFLTAADTWWAVWSPITGPVLLQPIASRVKVRVFDMQRSERPSRFVASTDGSRLFTARVPPRLGATGVVETDPMRIWSALGIALGTVTTADDPLAAAAFSRDGAWLATGRHSGGFVSVHVTAPVELATEVPRWREGEGYRYAPALTLDGSLMAAFADETTLLVLRDDGTERSRVTVGQRGGGLSRWLGVVPHQDLVLHTAQDGSVTAYDLDGKTVLRVAPEPPATRAAAIGRDGGFVTVVAGPRVRFHAKDGTVVAEVAGELLAPDPTRGFEDEAAIFSESSVSVCGPDGAVRRTLAVPAGQETTWYHGCPAGPAVLVTNPRGFRGPVLATCRYVDAAGRTVWEAPVGGVGMRGAVVSPDGERVAIVASGGLVLRDAAGREVSSLRLAGGIASLSFDGSGRFLAASSQDGTVRVWDRDGLVRFMLPNQGGSCFLAFSQDGRRLATVTGAMARLFTTDVDELEALAARRSTRGFTLAERTRFGEILAPAGR